MSDYTTKGILIRRIEYGDYDFIITFLTDDRGKITVIAKNAKKSIKRFFGLLELFSHVNLTLTEGRKKGLTILKESSLEHPFANIREDIISTTYANYWAEITNLWLEENVKQEKLYNLFLYILDSLDNDRASAHKLSLLFQIRFLEIAGLSPILDRCTGCSKDLEGIRQTKLSFDLSKGSIVCRGCVSNTARYIQLSKGTVKQLIWLQNNELKTAGRIKYSNSAISEGLAFLEAFVPFHIGREPRSLAILRNIR